MKKLCLSIVLSFWCAGMIITAGAYSWAWARNIGNVSPNDTWDHLAIDSKGNVYVTTTCTGRTLIIGNDTIPNTGYQNIFIAKYDSSGNALWAKSIPSYGNDGPSNIATDGNGNIYLVGTYTKPTQSGIYYYIIGNDTLYYSGGKDIFIAKFDTSGNILWAKSAGGTADDYVYAVCTDAAGNACITGYSGSDSLILSPDTLIRPNFFTAKYDQAGNLLWAKAGNGVGNNPNSISADASGNIYVAGSFNSPTLGYDSIVLTNLGLDNSFIVKYDVQGRVKWAQSFGGNAEDYVNGVTTDIYGDIYVTGNFFSYYFVVGNSDTVYNNFLSGGGSDIFLIKYDSSGNVKWAKSAGNAGTNTALVGSNYNDGLSVATDSIGNVFVAGRFSGSAINFDTDTLLNVYQINSGVSQILLVNYDTSGRVIWAKSAGSNDQINSINVSINGSIYATGVYHGKDTINFDNGISIENTGFDYELFVAKLNRLCLEHDCSTTEIQKIPDENANIVLYPNPASGNCSLQFNGYNEILSASVFDITGREIMQLFSNQHISTYNFNVSSLPVGLYFVKVNPKSSTGKFEKAWVSKLVKE